MRVARGWAVLVILVLWATSAMAAGFRLPTAGAKAMGMGYAFSAQADDPSAIYYNPAGLIQLEGHNVMAGVTYVKENGAEFTGSTPLTGGATVSETQKDLDFFIPNAYYARKASPSWAYGIGIFAPFGLGQEYENRNTSIFRNQVTKIELRSVAVNPTVAWKVNEVLSIGAGIDFLYASAKLDRTPVSPLGTNLFKAHLEGDGTAWGYNFGFQLKPVEKMKVGLSFRSPFHMKIKDADVTLADNVVALPLTSKADATINMPATAAVGVSYAFSEKLTVEADADWTFWHAFKELRIVNKTTSALSSTTAKDWKDVVAFRIGGEYKVIPPLALRLGFAYDPTPVPARTMGPELPDSNRLTYHAGVGYKVSNWTIDAAYYYLDRKDRTVSNINQNGPGTGFDGIWKANAHLVALDIGYRF